MSYIGNPPAEAYTNTVKDTFSGDGTATSFTLSLPTTTNNVRVVVENVVQDPTVAYGVSGTTLTFTSAPPSGTNNIYVVHLGPAVQTVQPPSDLSGNFTLTGDLTQTGDYTLTGDASISGQLDTASILPIADATSSLGIGSNRYTDLFLSGGVYLGGTGSANYLDDYETGTFTPTLDYDTSGTLSVSYSVQAGNYVKIGNMVFVRVEIRLTSFSKGTASGNVLISNLPFTAKLHTYGNDQGNTINTWETPLPTTSGHFPTGQFSGSTTNFSLRVARNNSSLGTFPDPDSNSQYKISGYYQTDA